jgi:excisionase family DNA binding protein
MLDLEGDVYLTSAEACAMLGVKPATLYAYVTRNVLTSYRQGIRRERLYRLQDIERLLKVEPTASGLVDIPLASTWVDDK